MNKSIVDISWKVDEPTYRADPSYSYSTIAKFSREGFRKLDSLFDKVSSPSLLFGGLVDTLLTGTKDDFNNSYFVATFPKISETLEGIVRTVYSKTKGEYKKLSDVPEEIIHKIAIENNYFVADKYAPTRLKNILECSGFYDLLILAGEKTVISREILSSVERCAEELRTNEYTKGYFNAPGAWDDIEIHYQLKFKGEYEGIPLRCMLDCIIVDHKKKKIILVDLKTSFHYEEDFMASFEQWSYFIQAQLYAYLVEQNIRKDDYFKDFTIENYKFVVINRFTLAPLVWEFPFTFAITNMVSKNTGTTYPNWRTIVQDLDYYLKYRPKYPKHIQAVNTITNFSLCTN